MPLLSIVRLEFEVLENSQNLQNSRSKEHPYTLDLMHFEIQLIDV